MKGSALVQLLLWQGEQAVLGIGLEHNGLCQFQVGGSVYYERPVGKVLLVEHYKRVAVHGTGSCLKLGPRYGVLVSNLFAEVVVVGHQAADD